MTKIDCEKSIKMNLKSETPQKPFETYAGKVPHFGNYLKETDSSSSHFLWRPSSNHCAPIIKLLGQNEFEQKLQEKCRAVNEIM